LTAPASASSLNFRSHNVSGVTFLNGSTVAAPLTTKTWALLKLMRFYTS